MTGQFSASSIVNSIFRMRVLILVVCFYFFSVNAVDNEDLQTWVESCRSETGFDKKNYTELEDLIKDPESKKLFLCVATVGGMLEEDGSMNRTAVREVLPEKIKKSPDLERLLDECVIKKDTAEESVFNTFICVEKRIYYTIYGKKLDI
ncbi:uncharacterized protein LOC123308233 [Coccinella septempunctata]|uniref:uncharacterized protein LOC123308233 n=1 Tax=Coccinella septempunctata TaxID=41139 RepID=UPI001D08A897|nr:uncharacterized protein LOC123308233 [Coccinella septempunctata]